MPQSQITPFRRHIFVCVNKRDGKRACEDHGAKKALDKAKEAVKALPYAKREGVRLSQSGCLGQCEHGPVAVVYPGGKWISYSSADELVRFVLEAVEAED